MRSRITGPVLLESSADTSRLAGFSCSRLGNVRNTHDSWVRAISKEMQAAVWAALGQIDDAVKELRAVHETGWAFGYNLRLYPEWEPLRGDEKFQQLMKEAEARADAQPKPKK